MNSILTRIRMAHRNGGNGSRRENLAPAPANGARSFWKSQKSPLLRRAYRDRLSKPFSQGAMKEEEANTKTPKSVSHRVNEKIGQPRDDWRSETLRRVRFLIKEADPEIVEEQKWMKPSNPEGIPVWSHDGLVCTGEIYKDHVKLTFARGASLKDPAGLFNQNGTVRRAIDIHEGDKLNGAAFKNLIRAAVALNTSSKKKST